MTHIEKFSDRKVNNIPYIDELISLINKEDIILDVGCGVGNVVDYLSKEGANIIGITINEEEIKMAESLKRVVIHGDIQKTAFKSETFNTVIMWDVLEHLRSPLNGLEEVHRILKDGGRLLLYVPSEKWIETSYHIIVPNIRQTMHLAKLAGFTKNEVRVKEEEAAIYIFTKWVIK